MGFMVPTAEYMTATQAFEYVGIQGSLERHPQPDPQDYPAGWYARLSAPGYLDCTDWSGPFKTEEEALQYVMELYDVDEHGDEVEA